MVSSTVPPSCFPVARHCTGTRPSGHADLSLFRVLAQAKRPFLDSLTGVPLRRDKAGSRSSTNILGVDPPAPSR